jgi:hypothetical protein
MKSQLLGRWRQENHELEAKSERPCLKNKIRTKGLVSSSEHLSNRHEALGPIPGTRLLKKNVYIKFGNRGREEKMVE